MSLGGSEQRTGIVSGSQPLEISSSDSSSYAIANEARPRANNDSVAL